MEDNREQRAELWIEATLVTRSEVVDRPAVALREIRFKRNGDDVISATASLEAVA